MCECLAYDDGTQHTCEACVPLNEYACKRLAALEPAAREALAALPGEGAEGPLPGYGPCPYYRNGEPHSNCEVCGGLGALPILPVDILAPQSPEVEAAAEALRQHVDSIWAITPEEFDSAGQPGVAKTIRLARALLAALSSARPAAPAMPREVANG